MPVGLRQPSGDLLLCRGGDSEQRRVRREIRLSGCERAFGGLPLDDSLRTGLRVLCQLVLLLPVRRHLLQQLGTRVRGVWSGRSLRGPALYQPIERFRVCFDAMGGHCTEYEYNFYQLGCGC